MVPLKRCYGIYVIIMTTSHLIDYNKSSENSRRMWLDIGFYTATKIVKYSELLRHLQISFHSGHIFEYSGSGVVRFRVHNGAY